MDTTRAIATRSDAAGKRQHRSRSERPSTRQAAKRNARVGSRKRPRCDLSPAAKREPNLPGANRSRLVSASLADGNVLVFVDVRRVLCAFSRNYILALN